MTVATKHVSWQNGMQPGSPYDKNSPNLMALRDYILKRWGGMNLGSYAMRPVRGGTRWSSHAFGAGWDWRWENPGPGRQVLESEVLPFLVDYSAELGIQQIHHYSRKDLDMWRAGRGWYDGNPGNGGPWLHIETHPDMWGNKTPVEQRIKNPVPESPVFPPFAPERGQWSLWPLSNEKPVLRTGATGDAVRYLQGVLKLKAGQTVSVDGMYGRQTELAVRNVQQFVGALADGIVGPRTWHVIDTLAR